MVSRFYSPITDRMVDPHFALIYSTGTYNRYLCNGSESSHYIYHFPPHTFNPQRLLAAYSNLNTHNKMITGYRINNQHTEIRRD